MVPEDKNHMCAHSGLFWWEPSFPPKSPQLLPDTQVVAILFTVAAKFPSWAITKLSWMAEVGLKHYKISWFPSGHPKYSAAVNQEGKFEQEGFCWSLQVSLLSLGNSRRSKAQASRLFEQEQGGNMLPNDKWLCFFLCQILREDFCVHRLESALSPGGQASKYQLPLVSKTNSEFGCPSL